MKNRPFIFLFIFIACICTNAQVLKSHFLDKKYYLVDSLDAEQISPADRKTMEEELKEYHAAAHDTTRFEILSHLVEDIVDDKTWLRYNRFMYDQALEKEKGSSGRDFYHYKVNEALALNNFGYYYSNFSTDNGVALKYYEDALKIHQSLQYYKAMVIDYSNMGNLYQNTGNLIMGLDYYKKALELENNVQPKSILSAPLNNMAQIYLNLGDTGNAVLTLKKCLIISKETKDLILKAHLLHNIGALLFYRGDSAGITNIKQALEIRRKLNDKNGIVHSCITLANVFVKLKQNDMADVYIKEAEKYLSETSNVRNQALYYNMMGRRHAGNIDEAIKYFEKAIEILKSVNAGTDLEESLQYLISTYGSNPKYAPAKLKAYELLETVNAKINKANLQKQMMQQKYDEQLQIRQAMFQVEEKIHEEKNNSEKKRRDLYMAGILIILAITIVYSFFLFKAVRKIRKNNLIISEQKKEVERQKLLVEEKHKDITDSINYAQRIQSALILSEQSLSRHFKEAFVLFKPRDIVSGDFYWFTEHEGKKIVALADCTGHGVPGAFMSMIGITLLNQIVNEKGITSPAAILTQLRKEVIRTLSTDASGKQDGMDMAIISIDSNEIIFSGANSKALIFNNGAFTELIPDKQPIGNYEKQSDFTERRIALGNDMKIYLFSDGIVDQFGGNRAQKNAFGKKLKIKQLKEWIISTSGLTLSAQKNVIVQKLEEWKKGFEQTDDISLIGIKLA